jgi:hypothetical protein
MFLTNIIKEVGLYLHSRLKTVHKKLWRATQIFLVCCFGTLANIFLKQFPLDSWVEKIFKKWEHCLVQLTNSSEECNYFNKSDTLTLLICKSHSEDNHIASEVMHMKRKLEICTSFLTQLTILMKMDRCGQILSFSTICPFFHLRREVRHIVKMSNWRKSLLGVLMVEEDSCLILLMTCFTFSLPLRVFWHYGQIKYSVFISSLSYFWR